MTSSIIFIFYAFGVLKCDLVPNATNSLDGFDKLDVTAAREMAKEHWISSIKGRLLEKLGFEEKKLPNITQKITLPIPLEIAIEQQYATQSDDSFRVEDKSEKKLNMFSTECHTLHGRSDDFVLTLSFNLETINPTSIIDTATLVFKKLALNDASLGGNDPQKLRILLYHILEVNPLNGTLKRELLESRGVASFYENDLSFVVTSAISHWAKKRTPTVDFQVVVDTTSGRRIDPLRIFTLRDCSKIGWSSWIIAPKSFLTGRCLNSCPRDIGGTQDSNLQQTCKPVYKDLLIVYTSSASSNEIVVSKLPNFAIVDCQCSS